MNAKNHARHPDPTPEPIDHIVVENDNHSDELALFPRRATEDELLTEWITALEGSYVSLEDSI